MMIRMLVAVGGDQLGQLLDIGADLQLLDRSGEPLQIEVVRLLHHLIKEVVNAQPERQAIEAPKILGEAARPAVAGFLQQVEEASSIISSLPSPASRLHRVGRVAGEAQQPHQADGVVGAVDRAKVSEAILDLWLLIEPASAADLVGNPP